MDRTLRVVGARDVRRVNKNHCADFFDVSVQTILQWVKKGMPYVVRGEKGRQWEFDLYDCCVWKFGGEVEEKPIVDPDMLPPKDRLDHYRADAQRDANLEKQAQLIPADVYEREMSEVFKMLSMLLEGLPDLLERDCGLTPAAVERVQLAIDGFREPLAQRIADFRLQS